MKGTAIPNSPMELLVISCWHHCSGRRTTIHHHPLAPPLITHPQVPAEIYAKMVDQINANRLRDGDVDARSVTEALAALGVVDSAAEDKHPEK